MVIEKLNIPLVFLTNFVNLDHSGTQLKDKVMKVGEFGICIKSVNIKLFNYQLFLIARYASLVVQEIAL